MLRSQALETLLNLLNLTRPCTQDSQNLLWDLLCTLLQDPLNLTWLCTMVSWNLLGNLLRTPLNLTWLCTKPSQTFSGTFSGTLLNLTWLSTKASRNLLRNLLQNPVEPDLALHQSSPKFFGTLVNLTSLCTKGSRPSPEPFWNLLWNPVEPDLALHQGFLEPSPEPSPEPCWTWPGSAPKPPGFFSGTFRNLRNLLWNLVEPDPAAAPVHTGAILCWLAYAVGEKSCIHPVDSYFILFETVRVHKEKCQERIVH